MSKEQALLHYKTAVALFNKWHSEGIISKEELSKLDTIIAQKYGLSLCSIYR